jgi:FkbM family methyltransferase
MPHPEIEILFESLEATLRKSGSPSLFAGGRPVYIYGAGNVGRDVLRVLASQGVSVAGFLDRNARPDSVWGETPILQPDDPVISAAQRQRSHVVIGIFNRDVEMPPIAGYLKTLGYGLITSFLDLHDQFALELGDRFWLTSRHFYPEHQQQISAGYELWSDEASRDLYASVLKFRFAKSYEALPSPSFEDQYFPKGLPPWPSPIRMIDCGAYDGDTLRALMDGRASVGAIAAFEPDPDNFGKLTQSVCSNATAPVDTICLFPCGVSSETTQLRFSSGQGSASCASENGDTVIQCVSLDDALPVFRPNVIKMDIEGAEYAALLGARRMIEQNRPGLAISVYHRPEHLWAIPFLARTWLKGGQHYLRMHAYNAFELIYYWMP